MSEPTRPTPTADTNLPKASIPAEVFRDLLGRVLAGEWTAGHRLPAERALAAEYGINRNTLREALRRLEHAGLVSARQGQGVTVLDFRRRGTLELLGPFMQYGADTEERLSVARDVLTARRDMLVRAVAMAAERANAADIALMRELTARQLVVVSDGDRAVLAKGDLDWIDAVVDAAHSLTVRWIANTILGAFRDFIERQPGAWVPDPGYGAFLTDTIDAIADGDVGKATRTTAAYFERLDARLSHILEVLARSATRLGEQR